jgi:hypothetical protein
MASLLAAYALWSAFLCPTFITVPRMSTAVKQLKIRNNRLGQGLRESEVRKLAIVHLPRKCDKKAAVWIL